MIQTEGSLIKPFPVGQLISNNTADVAKYNVFAITLQEAGANSVGNFHTTYLYSKGVGDTNYGTVIWNNSYNYWCWYKISLSGNNFTATGKRYFSTAEDGVTHSQVIINAIYGIV